MSITRTALPLILVSGLLTGCAGLQKSDWPTCAAVGGVTDATTDQGAPAGPAAAFDRAQAGA
ncbi:OmpA family protein, partial [Pseudomonas aeruginosa]|nr:OmpA family protein [Pseudomonas aeruginosa]